jgi:UPF0755 protein
LKRTLTIISAVILLVLMGAGGIGLYAYTTLFRVSDAAGARDFTVNAGESYIAVAMRLERRGLVPSAMALQIYGRVTGGDTGIQKGSYIIPEGLSPVGIMEYLSSGHQSLIRITIPEGRTLRQVAEIFDASGIVGGESFLAAANDTEFVRSWASPVIRRRGMFFPKPITSPKTIPLKRSSLTWWTPFSESSGR